MARMNRWIIYQRERFPLAAHAPLIAAFSLSAVCFSARFRTREMRPWLAASHESLTTWSAVIVAFVTSLLFFLQLRIADEHKDFDEDARYRPYRPVPRGLVTLRELTWIGIGSAIIQLALALWLSPGLIWLLVVTWGYFALMTREFFVREWLKARPVAYLFSHMLIMPLVDLYATACDWFPITYRIAPEGLILFLSISFCNGLAIEIGRKIRAPESEEHGVETYSRLWGMRGAITAWLAAISATAVVAVFSAKLIDSNVLVGTPIIVLLLGCIFAAIRFLRTPNVSTSKGVELMTGIWTLGMYISVGVLPYVKRFSYRWW
jgi:4-hydroxybenzoate polyprenyltransferase